jgi:hypothetical protein
MWLRSGRGCIEGRLRDWSASQQPLRPLSIGAQ